MPLQRYELGDPDGLDRFAALFRYAEVGRCVNGAAHEINNHLTAMLAYADLVQMDSGIADDARQMIERVIDAAEKCSEVVSSLNAVARKDWNLRNQIDLKKTVNDALRLRQHALRHEKINVEFDCPAMAVRMVGDGPKLQMALVHLLLNAEEALETAEIRHLRLRLRVEEGRASIEVWNSGSPVEPADCGTIFEPFMTSKIGPHLGFGLAAVRAAVAYHGGDVACDPERGFVITLPLAEQPAGEA
jgi:C4-dicarboxylate-specific signal transduction histidine kinase